MLALAFAAALAWTSPHADPGRHLRFEPAPAAAQGRYVLGGRAFRAEFQDGGVRFRLPTGDVRMSLHRGRAAAELVPSDLQPGVSHYFIGRDPAGWRRNVPRYGRLDYRQVRPGVDWVFYAGPQGLEHHLHLAAGVDPAEVRLRFDGARGAALDAGGNLVLRTGHGELVQKAPLAYQDLPEGRRIVPSRYDVRGPRDVRLAVGAYDRTRPLVIDPVIEYSTFLGGTQWDEIFGIALDGAGNIVVAGGSLSSQFPVHPVPPFSAGAGDAFVAKFTPDGSSLVYAAFLGGEDLDWGLDVATDAAGNAYVVGFTHSTTLPVANAVQGTLGGGRDAFAAKFSPDGSALLFSTYLGGTADDDGRGIDLDADGNVYVAGYTLSTDFPVQSALQTTLAGAEDAFLTKLSGSGSPILYSTYLGGSTFDIAWDVAVDAQGRPHVAGVSNSDDFPVLNALQPVRGGAGDAFVTRLNAAGTQILYSTYLGGSDVEHRGRIAVDAAGGVFLAGETFSQDFPTLRPLQAASHGFYDGYAARIDPNGALVYATYLGGASNDHALAVAIDARGAAYVCGSTQSGDFPTRLALQPVAPGPGNDGFFMKIGPAGRPLVHSTYMGGQGIDFALALHVEASGRMRMAGRSTSSDFPLVDPLQGVNFGGNDGWLATLVPDTLPQVMSVDAQATGASDGNGVLDPGETVALRPAWLNDRFQPVSATGAVLTFGGPGPATYTVVDGAADYGTLAAGAVQECTDCYTVEVSTATPRPAVHWDASLEESLPEVSDDFTWAVHVGESFTDVARTSPFYRFVETLFHRGVTGGCAASAYCPKEPVSRGQAAVFALVGREWPGYVPRDCAGPTRTFTDVPASHPFCPWVEELARRGVVGGCAPGLFCPQAAVTRAEMPVLVLGSLEGRNYVPPACGTPRFADLPAASPFCPWVEELARRGVVNGCTAGAYCPGAPVTREQMAVFVSGGFGLTLYGP